MRHIPVLPGVAFSFLLLALGGSRLGSADPGQLALGCTLFTAAL